MPRVIARTLNRNRLQPSLGQRIAELETEVQGLEKCLEDRQAEAARLRHDLFQLQDQVRQLWQSREPLAPGSNAPFHEVG